MVFPCDLDGIWTVFIAWPWAICAAPEYDYHCFDKVPISLALVSAVFCTSNLSPRVFLLAFVFQFSPLPSRRKHTEPLEVMHEYIFITLTCMIHSRTFTTWLLLIRVQIILLVVDTVGHSEYLCAVSKRIASLSYVVMCANIGHSASCWFQCHMDHEVQLPGVSCSVRDLMPQVAVLTRPSEME